MDGHKSKVKERAAKKNMASDETDPDTLQAMDEQREDWTGPWKEAAEPHCGECADLERRIRDLTMDNDTWNADRLREKLASHRSKDHKEV